MGLTIYQSITRDPAVEDMKHVADDKTSLCSSNRGYTIKRWLGVRRSTWLLAMYLLAYSLYLVGGCILFASIEQNTEVETKTTIENEKRKFVESHQDVTLDDLEDLLEKIMHRGISPRRRDLNNSNWSFGQSFLFTVTVVTTIGYGHINPVTFTGKIICILYAVIGIPFTLVFLSALVQRLLAPTIKLLSSFIRRLPHMNSFQIRLIHLTTLGSLFLLLFILLPSLIFYLLEPGWSLLDGFYFVFISLTTIGLGDYIPGDSEEHETYRDIYKTCVGIFLLLGLVVMSLTLTVFYDIPQLNLGLHLLRHKDIKAEDGLEEGRIRVARQHTDSENSTQTILATPCTDRSSSLVDSRGDPLLVAPNGSCLAKNVYQQ